MSLLTNFIIGVSDIKPTGLPKVDANEASIGNILSVFFGIIGALAVLMIVVSGLRYMIAAGDPQRTAQAKSGIVYALVGIAVAISAQGIVYFVVNRL